MNTKWLIVAITAALPIITAVEQDYGTYRAAKKTDPSTEFDWGILLPKVARSLVTAIAGGLGVSLAVGE